MAMPVFSVMVGLRAERRWGVSPGRVRWGCRGVLGGRERVRFGGVSG